MCIPNGLFWTKFETYHLDDVESNAFTLSQGVVLTSLQQIAVDEQFTWVHILATITHTSTHRVAIQMTLRYRRLLHAYNVFDGNWLLEPDPSKFPQRQKEVHRNDDQHQFQHCCRWKIFEVLKLSTRDSVLFQ